MAYTIITENDTSQWDDKTGVHYHFPNKYLKFLNPGTEVIYYKGKIKDNKFKDHRLSSDPHYFAIGTIGSVKKADSKSIYAEIRNYQSFSKAVSFKLNGSTIELIPTSRESNYWRDGVRPINKEIYDQILRLSSISVTDKSSIFNDIDSSTLGFEFEEGGKKTGKASFYERNPELRAKAIEIHGYTCMCCSFNFKNYYGDWGEGYIHVHHLKPISESEERKLVNPKNDLVVLCANCHSMVHRRKDKLLSLEELKEFIRKAKK